MDPRTPVLVGVSQLEQRAEDPATAEEPLALMETALRRAGEDAGAPSLLAAADSIRIPQGLWRYANPGAWLGEALGAAKPHTGLGPISGSTVQHMLHLAAVDVQSGQHDVVLMAGAECEHSRRRLRRRDEREAWSTAEGPPPDDLYGDHRAGYGEFERRYRLRPMHVFSLYENAIRHDRGESLEAHRARIGALWADFSRIAAANPHAWIQQARSAREVSEPGPENRMVAFPYTKWMVANMVVDKAAALILCSVEAARRHGVPESRWVFPHAATDVTSLPPLPERRHLHDQPALGLAGRRALELAGCEPGDLGPVDLYSCFPSAVQIAAAEVGIPIDRELSVTGGLTFGGGPFNSGVLHALATTVERLREAPEAPALVSGLGGYMAKHAFGIYGAAPAPGGFRYEDCTDAAQAIPQRGWTREYTGAATVETYAQQPASGEDAPDQVWVAALTPEGERVFGVSEDPELFQAAGERELCGLALHVDADGAGNRVALA